MTTDRHGKSTNRTNGREYVWIVNRFQINCAECGDEQPPGSHILWFPEKPRDQNNFCAPCGTDIAGSYPPANYWERRDETFRTEGAHGV